VKFKISSGLKSIIGKDLITDDFIAIFELVKNSFDAYADRVDLYFTEDHIYIFDNGKGMSKDDIQDKWLFVAYSAKSDNTEDQGLSTDYRTNLRAKRNSFAGSKGVGRFSCDRLGTELQIQTSERNTDNVHQIELNWESFEADQSNQFQDMEVNYSEKKQFDIPFNLQNLLFDSGTILKISSLRDSFSWDRKKLLRLKSAIAKLIDPFGIKKDFSVFIHAPAEKEKDEQKLADYKVDELAGNNVDKHSPYLGTVNGKIENLIFDKLAKKTTQIKVKLSEDCKSITTELIDRGELVYRIKEPSPYQSLGSSTVMVELYYMNTIAKTNFTKTMGLHNTKFGSVFLFNNGFRVVPIGNFDDDSLGLNSRKTQGYGRFLGTRELLGLIEVAGSAEQFKEGSSRDNGLIKTAASEELRNFFYDKALKRLEAYVSNVSWTDKLDAESEDLSRILTDQGKTKVTKVLAKLISGKNIELLEYSEALIDTISVRSEGFEESITYLQNFAEKSNTQELQKKINTAITQFEELKAAEAYSKKEAEREKLSREKAEHELEQVTDDLDKASQHIELVEVALKEEKSRVRFLKKATSPDLDTIRNFHHQIGIYSSSINHLVQHKLDNINRGQKLSEIEVSQLLEQVSFKNQQILTISRIATVADYRLSAEEINDDIIQFSSDYLENVVSQYQPDISVKWLTDDFQWTMDFMPLDLMIVIDNIVHNASKPNNGCTEIVFKSSLYEKNRLQIEIFDNGFGFAEYLKLDIDSIFDIGVTTTDGSGLGLFHVKQVINEMGGSISADPTFDDGAKFIIRFAR
jgi:signal transduction histidine kinase